MFFDDVKTLYDLGTPESHTHHGRSELQRLPQGREGDARSLSYLPLENLKVVGPRHREDAAAGEGRRRHHGWRSTCRSPTDKQSAHLRVTGTLTDPGYTVDGGDLVFSRTMKGLRNTVLLPAGWEVSAVSQSGTIGQYQGRAFVALINLNAENQYSVRIRASRVK